MAPRYATTRTDGPSAGELIRSWRERRRLTQLDLALVCDVSTRHLSCIETGKSRPTSTMLLGLAEHLDVPLRERNRMLLAAGHAPAYAEYDLDEAPMAAVSDAILRLLSAHDPYPAVVLDRNWDLIDANQSAGLMMTGAAPKLLEPPVNLVRLSLHPEGMAPRIHNLAQWRSHLLHRLERQAASGGDPALLGLLDECRRYPGGLAPAGDVSHLLVDLVYDSPVGRLSLFGTTTVFGSPHEVTVSELAVEAFYPTDSNSEKALRATRSQASIQDAG